MGEGTVQAVRSEASPVGALTVQIALATGLWAVMAHQRSNFLSVRMRVASAYEWASK